MSLYKCIVYDENIKRKVIKVNLESKEHIGEYAFRNNLKVVSIKNIKTDRDNKKIKDKEMKILCKEMSILIESGCEVTKLLSILKKQSSKKVSDLLGNISNQIQKGNSITESFRSTGVFSNFFISMIRAGEVSGNLDIVMNNLSDYYDKEYKLKSKIATILIYPIILTLLAIVSILFILIFIVPNFQTIFENNNINPPFITKMLIGISIFLNTNYMYIVLGGLIFITLVIYSIKTSSKIKDSINDLKMRLPIIKVINQLIITTRFSRALYILVNSGIQIIDAIDISAKVIDNDFAYKRILISNEHIKQGNSIGESLNLSNIFPKLFISIVVIGEESGKLDSSLNTINRFYENEVDTKIDQSMRFVEPIVTIVIGIIVGAAIISMVTPMFDAITSI